MSENDRNPYLPGGDPLPPSYGGMPPSTPPPSPSGPSGPPQPPPPGQPPYGVSAGGYGSPGQSSYAGVPPPPAASPYLAQGPYATPYPAGGTTNGFATASLVCGLVMCFAPLSSILAIVFGHVALSQIRHTAQTGRGMAIAGLVIGYATLALGVVYIAALVFSVQRSP